MDLFTIQTNSPLPIWRQIERQVQQQIAGGRLRAGDALPSVREVATTLRINPATVSRAYRRLVDLELLETRRGEGTFVSSSAGHSTLGQRRRELSGAAESYAGSAVALGFDSSSAVEALHDAWPKPGPGDTP